MAAADSFGVWLVANFLCEAVIRAQPRFGVIATAQQLADLQRTTDTKLANLGKHALRGRDREVPMDTAAFSREQHRMCDASLELGFVQSFFDDWSNLKTQAGLIGVVCAGLRGWLRCRDRVATS